MTQEETEILLKATTEAANTKAAELSTRLGIEVTPFCFVVEDKAVIGYMKDPSRMAKLQAYDLYERTPSEAGIILLRSGLIREESDRKIVDSIDVESSVNDKILLASISFANKFVTMYVEQLKKK